MHVSRAALMLSTEPEHPESQPDNPAGLLWGAERMAKFSGLSVKQIFDMLQKGMLPSAKRIGGKWSEKHKRWFGARWCITKQDLLKDLFGGGDAA